ncbi:MAG: DUF1015 domain-containing protein [Bacteroidota bacterium]
MPQITPFKAIRPAKDKVAFVASRSYEAYPEKERRYHLKYNPFSFLHIIDPGFKFHQIIVGEERFSLVRNRYLEFLEEKVLVKDTQSCFYLYQIQHQAGTSLGLFCATSVEDYDHQAIKKHEDTLEKREILFAQYLKTVGFNAEPVLMTYPPNTTISTIISKEVQKTPEYHFTTPDKVSHQLWKIDTPSVIQTLQDAFGSLPHFYIGDGHHRSASSALLAKEMRDNNTSHTGKEPYNFFLSYLIPETDIQISGFNRLIRDLNGLSKEAFLIQLDTHFRIEEQEGGIQQPIAKHHFCMYLDGAFYLLHLRKNRYQFTNALSALDAQILYITILQPILGIQDLRNDKRISYGQGGNDLLHLKKRVDGGHFAVGFHLAPTTIDEIKAIADANLVMPPKSTYIEPKLRSGLAIYEI